MIQNIRDKNGRRIEKHWSLKNAFTGFMQPKFPSLSTKRGELADPVSSDCVSGKKTTCVVT